MTDDYEEEIKGCYEYLSRLEKAFKNQDKNKNDDYSFDDPFYGII